MSNIYFTSDSHYSHSNLCLGVSKWDNKELLCRNFQTIEEMNDSIVKGINNTVKEDDILYHLGDWSFGGISSILEFRQKINCKNIHLIFGNHDHHIINNKIISNQLGENIKSKSLFSSTQHYLNLKINKQHLILSHYPIEEWEGIDIGYIHLHGHCHHSKDNSLINIKYRRMDVGLDWSEFRPFSYDEIIEIMKNKENFIRYETK